MSLALTRSPVEVAGAQAPAAPRRRRGRRAAFTLIEIAMALGVLAIISTAVFSSLVTANLAAATSRESQAASEEGLLWLDSYAAAGVDALLANSEGYYPVKYKTGQVDVNGKPMWTLLVAGPAADFGYVTADPGNATVTAADPTPVGRRRAVYVNAAAVPNTYNTLVEIRVTVCWVSVDGVSRKIELKTRVTK